MATAWLVMITLSTADVTAHIIENPYVPAFLEGREVVVTLVLLALLEGFREAIGAAVLLVVIFLLLNLVIVAVGLLYESALHTPST